ncbi:SDR family NAD(P)-dependent oxidoreductase [Streptomyces violaceusniger]|uniref:SDR family NAD(P)-dependent oxidoreductase n=1 Tax=Streptomyces violaceusniger TaxID=68280 RepID=UPI00099702F1|nr:SDR family NAD(P)-dependent oxidoreductase [Streptomyces hygroscopicus]AQW48334.1 short-chain dehydrogenase [Streptomyces hygroscopicus]
MTNSEKVALVTGGANGIGLACARQLHASGWTVVVADRDEAAGRELTTALPGSVFVSCDVSDGVQVDRAVAAAVDVGAGQLRGLVNNAGRTARTTFAELDEPTWQSLQTINLDSVYRFTRGCLPALAAGSGAVVNIASVAGLVGEEGLAGYSATKGAIIALTRSLALELGGLRVNAVCPGQVNTRLMKRVTSSPELLRAVAARIPAGRLGEPSEIASAVVWLLSDQASYVNGVALPVDGGETAGIRALSV